MAMPKRAGAPGWMVTFADMMSLLMALFVLLLSFSVMDVERYKKIAGAMKDSFGLTELRRLAGVIEQDGVPHREQFEAPLELPIPTGTFDGTAEPMPRIVIPPRAGKPEEPRLLTRIRTDLRTELFAKTLNVALREGRIVVSFPDHAAFDTASATLAPGFLPVLDKLASALERTEGDIVVSGHTDSVPITGGRFRSNWELSAARAVSVIEYWRSHAALDERRLTAAGHSATRPLSDNDTEEGRARNRRVEIAIRAQ
jgi:chemotaxis protein MotB